jgi:two-component system heavy metal sensor histidine kinase CusS
LYRSLRWRIAASYALLLVFVLATTSAVIVLRLQGILYDEALAHADAVMHEIVVAAQPSSGPFATANFSDDSLAQLFNSSNLGTWESPTTFVQIDSAGGYPISKTANLGAATIPANPKISADNDRAVRRVTIGRRPFLVEDRLLTNGATSAIVHVAEPLDELERTFAQTQRTIGLILTGAVVAVVALSILLASQAIGPIERLSQAMKQIGSERLNLRLPIERRHDEIGELTRSFNDLLVRLQEAFARERQFISDASHELKTPLTSINANAQLLLRWGAESEAIRRESLETIERESAALAQMVNGMLTLAKADRGDAIPTEPLSLAHIARESVNRAASRAEKKGLTLSLELSASPIIDGSPHLLRQLIGNLIDNAIKFTPNGGVVVRVGADGGHAWVEVEDTGPGIAETEREQIFDRFYRADPSRSRDVPGTGLGLAIVRSIARVHGATVTADRGALGGALFRATFPRVEESLTESS